MENRRKFNRGIRNFPIKVYSLFVYLILSNCSPTYLQYLPYVHSYVYHTVFVTSPRQGVGNGVNFRRKFLEFPILLRAERPDDVTETTKNLESHFAEFQNFQKKYLFQIIFKFRVWRQETEQISKSSVSNSRDRSNRDSDWVDFDPAIEFLSTHLPTL